MWSTNTVVHSFCLLLIISAASEVIGIIGGRYARLGMFPHHVSLHLDGICGCGGSLVSENLVLTAAHCVLEEKSRITAFAGIVDLKEPNNGQTFNIIDTIIHPSYNYSSMDYDIALIRLSQPARLNGNVQVITMATGNANYRADTVAFTTGYGEIDPHGTKQNCLKYVDIPLWDRQTCNSHYFPPITDRMICAGDPLGRYDPCDGDSGAGLTVNGTLIAVFSFGYGCGTPYRPTVYESVPYNRNWIDEVIHSQYVGKKEKILK